MNDSELEIDNEIVSKIKESLEQNTYKTQIDPHLSNLVLDQIVGVDSEVRKEAVIRALLVFTWTQRLYFIIRSALMALIGVALTAPIIFLLGRVNLVEVAIISIFSFIGTLMVTRFFDSSVNRLSKQVVSWLSHHRRFLAAVLNHF